MQQAYKPVLAHTPAQNLVEQGGHTCVVWSPERLNLSHKQIGIQYIEPRHFVLFTDQTYPDRDQSEAIFQADLNVQRSVVQQMKTAYACAYEVVIQHGGRGAVILDSFLDVSPAKVEALENKLVKMGWFTEPKLPNLISILDQVAASDLIEEQAINDLKQAIGTAVNYRLSRLDDAANEAQQARRPEGKGRAFLTRTEAAYYEEVDVEIPGELTMSAINTPAVAEAAPATGPDMAVVGAIVDVFAQAMNAHTEKILAQMKGGQTDGKQEENGSSKESGEEGRVKQARKSPLSTG